MRKTLCLLAATLGACSTDPPTPTTVRARIASDLGYVLHGAKDASGDMTTLDPDHAIAWLNENIFADDNSLGDGLYQVPPELVCSDQACTDAFLAADVRVRVEQDGDTLRFALQVDANHDEPLAFALAHTSVAITIDLDDATRALTALAPVLGKPAPTVLASGAITGKLEIVGDAHARASLAFDRAIAVVVGDLRLASAKADVVSLELDASAPLAFALALGPTTLHVPGARTIDLDLASLTITTDPQTGDQVMAVSPRFDLSILTDHAALGDTPPVYDITHVALAGAIASARGSSIVHVMGGSYAITTDPASYGFTATAGQCVTATPNASYTAYSVGPCY